MQSTNASVYFERLWPSPYIFVTLLLVIPAVTLTIAPINQAIALPSALAVYVILVVSLAFMSPTIRVTTEAVHARGAVIPLTAIGSVTVLNEQDLKLRIGTKADARAFLVVRGDIHRGVEIEILDVEDPTPYCIFTTRNPRTLQEKIEFAKRMKG